MVENYGNVYKTAKRHLFLPLDYALSLGLFRPEKFG